MNLVCAPSLDVTEQNSLCVYDFSFLKGKTGLPTFKYLRFILCQWSQTTAIEVSLLAAEESLIQSVSQSLVIQESIKVFPLSRFKLACH